MNAGIAQGREETIRVGATSLHLLRGGSGRPALVLHGMEGPEGWLRFHEQLSQQSEVIAPSHPGFGASERPDWMETITHQALYYEWFLRDAGFEQVDLIGFGIGGWIAAEMAAMCSHNLSHLVLIDAAGIRPHETGITDVFIQRWRDIVEQCIEDPEAEEFRRIYDASPVVDFGGPREAGRSMTMRMCFRPYMYSPSLEAVLRGVRTPALVVWGARDRIIPVECAHRYQDAIPAARLQILDDCGHWPHFEKPDLLADVVSNFIAT